MCLQIGNLMPESVVAFAVTDSRHELGWLCRECIAHMGRRNPQKYPPIEEFKLALKRYPKPVTTAEEARAQTWD